MNFPPTQKTFHFDYTSAFNNRYEGEFTVKCLLSIGEKHRLELEKTRLLGNMPNPTDELIGIAVILSSLRNKIVDSPSWWAQSRGGDSIQEEDVLAELFAKVQDAETEWRRELIAKTQKTQDPAPTSAT